MGRNRKLLEDSKRNLTVLEREEKELAEKRMNELERLTKTPPEWLDDTAKKEYKRIVPLLLQIPIASLDLALVSAYCQAYSDYMNATIRMNEGEPIIETPNGTKLNQNHALKRDALAQLTSIAPKIGLTIDSRMKIFSSKEPNNKKDPMGDMINAKRKAK